MPRERIDRDERRREAFRPLRESGVGEAEGFEEAEEALIEQAENPGSSRNPKYDRGAAEAEDDHAVHGEADDVRPSERTDRN